jgi:hypothetical protein
MVTNALIAMFVTGCACTAAAAGLLKPALVAAGVFALLYLPALYVGALLNLLGV